MLNRCANCGGLLNYDIPTEQLKCENCDSLFNPEEYEEETAARENPDGPEYSVSVFTCPNCGGQISSNESEAIEYCLYCGSFVTLTSQVESVKKPQFILPFCKTKDDCVKSYKKMIGRKLYAPREFKDEKFISGFKGIYIPFWDYGYSYGPDVNLEGVTETRKGDYIYKQHYSINVQAEGELDGIYYDASSSFDDEISSRITPFDTKKLKPFKSSYMFGFYGDTADIPANTYNDQAAEVARTEIWKEVARKPEVDEKNPKLLFGKEFDQTFHVKEKKQLSMLPVWFLTWRNKGRVAYSVVNGESGAIYSEVPVDVKRYLLFSLIFAIPIFMFLNLWTFNASNMLTISVVLSLLMLIMYSSQLDKIVRKQFHFDDKGYLLKHKESKKEAAQIKENIFAKILSEIRDSIKDGLLQDLGFGGIALVLILLVALSTFVIWGLLIVVAVAIVYYLIRLGKNAKFLKDGSVWGDVIGTIISLILGSFMLIADPAGDELYYIAAIICALGVGLTAIFTMKRYNNLVTRPLPHFFDRKKGGEE